MYYTVPRSGGQNCIEQTTEDKGHTGSKYDAGAHPSLSPSLTYHHPSFFSRTSYTLPFTRATPESSYDGTSYEDAARYNSTAAGFLGRGLGLGLGASFTTTGLGIGAGVLEGRGGLATGSPTPCSSMKDAGAQPSLGPLFTNHHPSSLFSRTSTLSPSLKLRQPSVLPEYSQMVV